MTKKPKISEQQYAEVLVNWLGEQGWEVYQEVPISYRTCDIVAVKRDLKIAWLIEVKKFANRNLFMQAYRCQYHSPTVSIAFPKTTRISQAKLKIMNDCGEHGIGLISIDFENKSIEELKKPDLSISDDTRVIYRRDYHELLELHEEYKTRRRAGSPGGWSVAKMITYDNIIEYVRTHPGCSLKSCVENIKHHYCHDNSAVSALSKIHHPIYKKFNKPIPGVEFRNVESRWRMFPKEVKEYG